MDDRKPKILVVDDELIIRRLVSKFLMDSGYEVCTAENGQEAIHLAEVKTFDLFLSDLHMPVMEGDELIRQIRARPEYRDTPFLFLSGDSDKDTWLRNLNAGADDFILKPFDPEILASKIKAHIKKSLLRKEVQHETRQKVLSEQGGIALYCVNEGDEYLRLLHMDFKVLTVRDAAKMVEKISDDNVWLVIIDDGANWALDYLQTVRNLATTTFISLALVKSQSRFEQVFDLIKKGVDNVFVKLKDGSAIVEEQINQTIRMESRIKNKYFSAIKQAANNSFIRFKNEMNINTGRFTVKVLHQPYETIPGGDFYEIYTIEQHNRLLVLGDVMGKKWDAWFFVSSYISYIRSLTRLLTSQGFTHITNHPARMLEHLNKYIFRDAQLAEVFTTLSLIYINDRKGIIRIGSAGAQKPLITEGSGAKVINVIGTLLGILEEVKYQELELSFAPGQKLLLYTDGFNEATNALTGEMIDNDDVLEVFQELVFEQELSPQKIEQLLRKRNNILRFDDDRTMVLIEGR